MKVRGTDAKIEKTELVTNAGYLAVNFCDRADVFATLGASHVLFNGTAGMINEGAESNEHVDIETRDRFSWSVGGRVTVWECDCWAVGVEDSTSASTPRSITSKIILKSQDLIRMTSLVATMNGK